MKIVNGCSGVAVIIMHEHVYIKITKLNNFTGFRKVTLNVWVLLLIYPKHMCNKSKWYGSSPDHATQIDIPKQMV